MGLNGNIIKLNKYSVAYGEKMTTKKECLQCSQFRNRGFFTECNLKRDYHKCDGKVKS